MRPRHLALPASYEAKIRSLLPPLGYDLDHDGKLADAVLQLSDFYISHPNHSTPWDEPWARAASLVYYFPLNYCRSRAVANEAKRLGFFSGLDGVHDFGSGMGSAVHAWADMFEDASVAMKYDATDVSASSLDLNAALSTTPRKISHRETVKPGTSLLLASYVLTELDHWPEAWNEYEALAIIEPSTQEDARRLMAEREPLLSRGYHFWGPCTHEGPCPLYVHSAKDWCHDRVHFDPPPWFEKIERHLPMKNRTLTFSYLLARRVAPPARLPEYGRMVGDTLIEKGKTRQALCRNPDREFLAWFPQRMEKEDHIELERGALVRLEATVEKKSNEVRLKSPADIAILKADETPY